MNDKIKELLAVLDMTEERQWEWLWNYIKDNWQDYKGIQFVDNIFPKTNREFWAENKNLSLADLAFRLRDEAAVEYTNQCA